MHRFAPLITVPLALGAAVVVQLAAPSEALAVRKRPAPTPSPTATATVSPTPTATVSPTPTATATVAPTATATVSPTATVAPTATATATPTTLFADDFSALPLGTGWLDGSTHGGWVSTYNGYGLNGTALDGTQVLTESPKVSTTASVTHASLVNTTASFGDMDTTVRLRTVQQLRTPTPNAWEVAWVLWHYTDDTHFYYLALKPNGWELGKEDPAYPGAQRYLKTSGSPTYAVGTWHTVRVRQIGNVMTVWADGTQLTSFTDTERPYSAGTLGLYNEDSLVHFDDVKVTTP